MLFIKFNYTKYYIYININNMNINIIYKFLTLKYLYN